MPATMSAFFAMKNARANRGRSISGFHAANGKWIVTLDGDGQNDPADILRACGHELNVSSPALFAGIRKRRNDGVVKLLTSKLANFVRKRSAERRLPGCCLRFQGSAGCFRSHICPISTTCIGFSQLCRDAPDCQSWKSMWKTGRDSQGYRNMAFLIAPLWRFLTQSVFSGSSAAILIRYR